MAAARILFACALIVFPSVPQACTCNIPSLEEMLESSDAVFAGTVFRIEIHEKTNTAVWLAVWFAVDFCWKGAAGDTVTVLTNANESACGYPFKVAERYLVFAYGSSDLLSTNLCTRTAPVWLSQDFDELGAPTNCEVPVSGTAWTAIKKLYLADR